MKRANKKSVIKYIMILLLAAILCVAAIFALWWYGAFLPKWVDWKTYKSSYYGLDLELKDGKLVLADNEKTHWSSKKDWFVQDILISDINNDGEEELVLLVWKHGSFGKHRPVWVKRNDINLQQHVFIYKYDKSRDEKLRAIWMSSAIIYEIDSIERCFYNKLLVNDRAGNSKVWYWQDFGLKIGPEYNGDELSVVSVGDNLIHNWMLRYSDSDDYDYVNGSYDGFYCHIKDRISSADIATVNQETPLVRDNSLIGDFPRFGSPAGIAKALSNAGFDVASCATNHMLDRGAKGALNTANILADNGIKTVGINEDGDISNNCVFINTNGIRVAFLSYTYGTNGIPNPDDNPYLIETFKDEERLRKQIQYARLRADAVIAFVHWGTEYELEPDVEQNRLVDILKEEKVDVVIGTHPHVIQNMELYAEDNHETTVFYSLGNFVSGQDRPERLVGGLASFDICKDSKGKTVINDPEMEGIVMHQSKEECAVYMLSDYSEKLASEHIVTGVEDFIYGKK